MEVNTWLTDHCLFQHFPRLAFNFSIIWSRVNYHGPCSWRPIKGWCDMSCTLISVTFAAGKYQYHRVCQLLLLPSSFPLTADQSHLEKVPDTLQHTENPPIPRRMVQSHQTTLLLFDMTWKEEMKPLSSTKLTLSDLLNSGWTGTFCQGCVHGLTKLGFVFLCSRPCLRSISSCLRVLFVFIWWHLNKEVVRELRVTLPQWKNSQIRFSGTIDLRKVPSTAVFHILWRLRSASLTL